PLAGHPERGHYARPVQDRVPGRDRRRLRVDRLPAVQRPFRPAAPGRAADLRPGHVEPDGLPPARGVRAGDHPAQLHPPPSPPAPATLPIAPALMRTPVVWTRSPTQQLAAHLTMRLFEAAGLPPGVLNLVTGDGQAVSEVALTDRDLAGIHFTGSTRTFQHLWRTVGENIAGYRAYPRLVGETGGKDFVLAHPSADPAAAVTTLVRGAFEYQGQK